LPFPFLADFPFLISLEALDFFTPEAPLLLFFPVDWIFFAPLFPLFAEAAADYLLSFFFWFGVAWSTFWTSS
jgi:hypothetical protein